MAKCDLSIIKVLDWLLGDQSHLSQTDRCSWIFLDGVPDSMFMLSYVPSHRYDTSESDAPYV
jgi:hypothetical protein